MEERICGIYCIENLVNGKRYVGQTLNFIGRKRSHKSDFKRGLNSIYLQSSFDKYGEENFEIYMVEECLNEELNKREIYYINLYETNNREFGYNLSAGGDTPPSWLGKNHKTETLKKMSLSAMGNQRWSGRSHKNETILKMRNSAMGRKGKGSSSDFIGVSKRKDCNKWSSNIIFNGERIHIGTYTYEIDAAKEYDNKAVELYGKNAKTNFGIKNA